ncbi:MAG: serine protease [Planctomycetia bacterium]|nr:serine protease [Planctomycetia bacterium]
MLRIRSIGTVLFAALVVGVGSASAGPMVHHIESVLPRAGQRGTTVDVVIQGIYLKDVREVIFFRPGIEAVSIESTRPMQSPHGTAHGGRAEEEVHCKFVIGADCPLGMHPFRLRTATELTVVSTFWVTPLATVDEKEPRQGENDLPAKALPIGANVAVLGSIDTGRFADVDLYRVAGKKGAHLSAEVASVWLTESFYAGSEADLMLRLLDADGKELARNDDSDLHIQDPIVSTILPRDGDYFVEVRQRIFKGASGVHYLAQIGTHRRPIAVYPAGGPAGAPLNVTLLGDPAGSLAGKLSLPSTVGDFEYYDEAPTPLPMRVSNYPNILEAADQGETKVARFPIALNGIIGEAGDADAFRFSVRKGEAYRVRTFARALGTPLDPRISIRFAGAEEPEVEADDARHDERDLFGMPSSFHRKELLDPSLVWTPKQDGEYVLAITDMRGLGGPTSVYRIEIEPVRDAIHTYLYAPVIDSAECPRLTAIAVPQGDRWTVNLQLAEGQGNRYKGELEIYAEGLPAGVQMIAPTIRAGQKIVPVQFIAAADAKPQGALIRLLVRPTDPSIALETGSHQAFAFLSHSGGRAWQSWLVDRYILAVTERPPYSIELVAPQIPLSQSGELSMQVNLTRHGSFREPIEIQFDWVPPGVQAQPTVTIEEHETSKTLRLFAGPTAQPAIWKVAATASTVGGSYYLGAGRIRNSSALVELAIAEPYVELKNKPAAVRRGEKSRIFWEVTHKKAFPGEAEAVLVGLPKGVSVVAPGPKLKVGDKELVFEVEAGGDALLGQYKELTCEIIVRQNGQEIRQRTGKGILRVDPPSTSTATTSTQGTPP